MQLFISSILNSCTRTAVPVLGANLLQFLSKAQSSITHVCSYHKHFRHTLLLPAKRASNMSLKSSSSQKALESPFCHLEMYGVEHPVFRSSAQCSAKLPSSNSTKHKSKSKHRKGPSSHTSAKSKSSVKSTTSVSSSSSGSRHKKKGSSRSKRVSAPDPLSSGGHGSINKECLGAVENGTGTQLTGPLKSPGFSLAQVDTDSPNSVRSKKIQSRIGTVTKSVSVPTYNRSSSTQSKASPSVCVDSKTRTTHVGNPHSSTVSKSNSQSVSDLKTSKSTSVPQSDLRSTSIPQPNPRTKPTSIQQTDPKTSKSASIQQILTNHRTSKSTFIPQSHSNSIAPMWSSSAQKSLLSHSRMSTTDVLLSLSKSDNALQSSITNSAVNIRFNRSVRNINLPPHMKLPRRAFESTAKKGCGKGTAKAGSLDAEEIARGLGRLQYRRIIVMSGAGISTPSGIPDFRTPGTGLYDNLKQYNIPDPTSIFDISYFSHNPKPFYTLARELYPGLYEPNAVHWFVRLLQDKGLLLRNYTQNIDGLERIAGIKSGKLVEAHGSFITASCIRCKTKQDSEEVKAAIFDGRTPRCKHKYCLGLVKPDIVFFGEDLPARFHSLQLPDFSKCDLLIIMGTSLEVEPFAGLAALPRYDVPRMLVNRELVGPFKHHRKRLTDIPVIGDLVESVSELVMGAGWEEDFKRLLETNDSGSSCEEGSRSKGWLADASIVKSVSGAASEDNFSTVSEREDPTLQLSQSVLDLTKTSQEKANKATGETTQTNVEELCLSIDDLSLNQNETTAERNKDLKARDNSRTDLDIKMKDPDPSKTMKESELGRDDCDDSLSDGYHTLNTIPEANEVDSLQGSKLEWRHSFNRTTGDKDT